MKNKIQTYPIYDLSNEHFHHVEIVTKGNKRMKGQFVRFKVKEEGGLSVFPAEKYCFLPDENKKEFWQIHNLNKGEFKEFPEYIFMLGLDEMEEIIIRPEMIL